MAAAVGQSGTVVTYLLITGEWLPVQLKKGMATIFNRT